MSPLREVARTIRAFFPRVTGPAKQAYEISRRLNAYGYASPIFTTTPSGDGGSQLALGNVETRRFPVTAPFMGFDFSLSFANAIMVEPLDLIHSHGYRDFLALHSYLTAKLKKRPFIVQPHGALLSYRYLLPPEQWRPYTAYDRLWSRIILEADSVVVSTDQEAKEAREFGVDQGRLSIVPPGAPAAEHPRSGKSGRFRVLFVGRISSGRNVHHLVDAFSRVSADEDTVLTIVGGEEKLSTREESGYLGRVKKDSGLLRNGRKVEFTGPLYGPDLSEMYSSAQLFVCASRYESFGQPLLEAAAYGLPIISTPVGVANDIVTNGRTGYLVDPNDIQGMADRIQEFVNNRERASDMGGRILALVKEKFDWNHIMEEYVSLYRRMSS